MDDEYWFGPKEFRDWELPIFEHLIANILLTPSQLEYNEIFCNQPQTIICAALNATYEEGFTKTVLMAKQNLQVTLRISVRVLLFIICTIKKVRRRVWEISPNVQMLLWIL